MSGRISTEGLELRYVPGDVRADLDGDRRLRGHAIVFNSLSVDLGGFHEIIRSSAVDRTLNEGLDVRALVDHDTSKVIGRTKSGTLELRKDRRGLAVSIDVDEEISYARDILRAVARGDVSGMSFAFRVPPGGDEWDLSDDGAVRYVNDMVVSEVTITAFPAYQNTDIAARSLRAFREQHGGSRLAFLEKWHRTRMAK